MSESTDDHTLTAWIWQLVVICNCITTFRVDDQGDVECFALRYITMKHSNLKF